MQGLKRASLADTIATLAEVIGPTFAKGVIIRRPKVTRLAERLDLDSRGVRRMQKLRATYGTGPLVMNLPFRTQVLVLAPEDVHRVLGDTEVFSPASREKRAALAHLEPHASLISEGPDRAVRRRFNEEVLDSQHDVHRMAAQFVAVAEEEASRLLRETGTHGDLEWGPFNAAWHAMVRRVTLGEAARDDEAVTEMLAKLRQAANWAFLHPRRRGLLAEFHARVDHYLQRAEPGTLAAMIAAADKQGNEAPSHQVAHWLFAFEPGAMAAFRALALLAAHPDGMARAREDVATAETRAKLPYLRGTVLEALRLWPTTPVILRETRQETSWGADSLARDAHLIIYAPFFHRDDETLDNAHRFDPEQWQNRPREGGWPLIPFSGGPGICPARHLVPMLASAVLAPIIMARDVSVVEPRTLDPGKPMPGLLDAFSLRLRLAPRAEA
ncbi:cytochrome P450 [Roseococcus microcysteis]|uniref:cytochrome P450 n=1 Tax=Roseococcus microcysteis TaxID=2771361 RepID=UPI00168B806D|nr:cytochrome P450 [Roseococcus microcysteis]